jgi:hypothetical protein
VAVVAISASEKQRGGGHIKDFAEFQQRLAALGLSHLVVLRPMFYWDVTFWDWSVWSDGGAMETLERQIHSILFPNVAFSWHDWCRAKGIDPIPEQPGGNWRNCKCDVQAIWTHIHNRRDVFVTSDETFHSATKKPALINLGANRIEYPDTAVSFL